METAVWLAIVATCSLVIILGGLVWKLATRIGDSESAATTALQRADTAALSVIANALKVEKVASELADHRESVAKEYVSYTHMVNLENRLVDAINSVGTRIDGLFSRLSNAQH